MCVRVRMCVRACVNKEKTVCLGFLLTPYLLITYIVAHSPGLSPCGTIFLFLCVQVTWQRVERAIARLNRDRRSSLKAEEGGGTWRISTSR